MGTCKATTGTYVKFKHTHEEKIGILEVVQKQLRQAIKGELVNCVDCQQERPLAKIYRCFFCGRYYCPACAKHHFT